MARMARRPAQLTDAKKMIQMSIRKRATAFVNARDDPETKIGSLSRRLLDDRVRPLETEVHRV